MVRSIRKAVKLKGLIRTKKESLINQKALIYKTFRYEIYGQNEKTSPSSKNGTPERTKFFVRKSRINTGFTERIRYIFRLVI